MLNNNLGYSLDLKDINTDLYKEIESFSSHDLRGKQIVLTGSMSLQRNEMTKLLESLGAIVKNYVSKKTDLLVVPTQYSPSFIPGYQRSNKFHKAKEHNIPTIADDIIIDKVAALKRAIRRVWGLSVADDITLRSEAWCKEFPFLINAYPWNQAKDLVIKNLELFKYIDPNAYKFDNGLLIKVIWRDGSLFKEIPSDKKKNVQIVETAMFADKNPKIRLCKGLLAAQIRHLDLKDISLKDREYICQVYLDKIKLDDVLLIAETKKHFMENTHSN